MNPSCRFDPPPGALEAIQKLREDLNIRLDALTESISPRNNRVGFIDVVTKGDHEGDKGGSHPIPPSHPI